MLSRNTLATANNSRTLLSTQHKTRRVWYPRGKFKEAEAKCKLKIISRVPTRNGKNN